MKPIHWLILAFIALSTAFSLVNPIHEGTDEIRHYRFVRVIAEERKLPIQGQEPCRSQSHHPPLYYTLAALATSTIDAGGDLCATPEINPFWNYRYWEVGTDNKNQYLHKTDSFPHWNGEQWAAHTARFVNVLIGAVAVYLTYQAGLLVSDKNRWLALSGAAIVAFNPMFAYMSGAINNDVIAASASAWVMVLCLRLAKSDTLNWKDGAWLGIAIGVALLSKFNNLALFAPAGLAISYQAWRLRKPMQWFLANTAMTIAALALSGWWFVRNQMLYDEPTGVQTLTKLWGVRDPRESFGLAVSEIPYAWTTLWGRFGFGQIPMPQWFYQILLLFTLVGILGVILRFIQKPQERVALATLAFFVGLFFAVLFNYMLISPAGPNGRFFFPGFPALAILIAAGWYTLIKKPKAMGGVITALFALLSLVAMFGYLRPAYARPSIRNTPIPGQKTNVYFEGIGFLRKFDISETNLTPGDTIEIDLFWEITEKPIGDFYYFLHLTDDVSIVAQRDTHPATGKFPTSEWEIGQSFKDTISIVVPEVSFSGDMSLNFGLYAPNGYRLPLRNQDRDYFSLGNVTVAQSQEVNETTTFTYQNFEGIVLLGLSYSDRSFVYGDAFTVDLTWFSRWAETSEPLCTSDIKLDIEFQLIDQNGNYFRSADQSLNDFIKCSSDKVLFSATTHHSIVIEESLPPGIYRPLVAIDSDDPDVKLKRLHPSGNWIGEQLELPAIRINE